MSPEQIRTLQTSFDRLWPLSKQVADMFYERLFVIAPHTRQLFPDNIELQKTKFMSMLASTIGLIERPDMFMSQITALGQRHKDYRVDDAHYAPVREALLWSLDRALAPDFDDDTRAAWSALYDATRDIMIKASRQADRAAP